jgi:transposase InsO family protein
MKGMKKRSRAPKNPFRKVTPRVETLVVHFKEKLPNWGATRVKNLLEYFEIYLSEPTIRTVWKKHGYKPQKRRKPHGFSENIKGGKKNAYWQVDLLYFDIDEGPLASVVLAIDTFSRYITCARVLERATAKNVVKALKLAFIKEGRPRTVVTDNGTQFCATFKNRTHAFVSFLASKKTFHLRIPFRQPRKNGIVERAVQNVKREALRPFKCEDHESVQKRVSRWRDWYNFRRRHLGIGNKRPAELFQPYVWKAGYYFIQEVLPAEVAGFTM